MYNVSDEIARVISRYARLLCETTQVSEIDLNGFVWTNDRYGIGKLVAMTGQTARVAFFHSITEIEEKEYPLSRLGRAYLSPQTRVYIYDQESNQWRVGRILWRFDEATERWYEVRFPNKRQGKFSETQLQVRCLQPKVDPTEVLAYGGMETQFFHDRRWQIVDTLIKVRAASRGLTGLISASIALLPHQVEISRRILEDPIQRYMLADEVGLGKTIEAGTIIRQCLLDNANEYIIVLTPPALVQQWEQELWEKFHIDDFPDSVIVLPFTELTTIEEGECDLLVIDEAHLLIARETRSDYQFDHLVRIAHSSRRLLLLSATPVLGHEETTLALLHLLDPVTYRLEDQAKFGERIERRQEYGQRLLALNPSLPPPILNQALRQILQTFPDDPLIAQLVEQLQQPEADKSYLIAVLKRHIAETYRLHQRLLRTRRREMDSQDLLPRQSTLSLEVDDDERLTSVWEVLEDWWYASQRVVDALGIHEEAAAVELEVNLAWRYLALVEALGRGVDEFLMELKRQQESIERGQLPTIDDEDEIFASLFTTVSSDPELFHIGDYLMTTLDGLDKMPADLKVSPRLGLAAAVITVMARGLVTTNNSQIKVLAFSSSTTFAKALYQCLLTVNGPQHVFGIFEGMSPTAIEGVIRRFRNSPQVSVLICDQSGELGLNFHFVQGIVHLDLPLSPVRLEQRIGRLDRFGRRQDVIRQRVIVPSDEAHSPWLAWYELLKDTFKIFDQSISEVHFVLDQLEQSLVLALYRGGATGLREMSPHINEELIREQQRLDEQYALDRLATDEEQASLLFTTLQAVDKNEADLKQMVVGWLKDVLHFSHRYAPQIAQDVFTYRWSQHTLAPEWPWRIFLADGLDRPDERRFLTFQRAVARQHPEVALIRPGFSLLDRIEHFMIWDDRGSAFATWRLEPEWPVHERGEWLGFRLCYVVEANIEAIVERLSHRLEPHLIPSIRRRADGFLPPWTEVVHIDLNLQEVRDSDLLTILGRSYVNSRYNTPQCDYNLSSRSEALFALIDAQAFVGLCRQVRQQSEAIVRQSSQFLDRIKSANQHTRQTLEIRNARLRQRNEAIFQETGQHDPNIETEIVINEAIITGITQPQVHLDSIGFFVIADYPPNEVAPNEVANEE